MTRYVLLDDASLDLEQIWEHVAADNIDAADQLIDDLLDGCAHLGLHPYSGHIRLDLVRNRRVRFWPVGNYLIIYLADKKPIRVVGVVHGSRNVPVLLKQRTVD